MLPTASSIWDKDLLFLLIIAYFNFLSQLLLCFVFKAAIAILAITLLHAVYAGGAKTRRTSSPFCIRHEWASFKIIKERPRAVTMIMLLLPAPSQC